MYEIRHQEREPPNMPNGWSFVGDLFLGHKCRACLFVDEQGRLRVRPEGGDWKDERHMVQLPVLR